MTNAVTFCGGQECAQNARASTQSDVADVLAFTTSARGGTFLIQLKRADHATVY
jgi:hypothetical protein